MLPKLVGLRDQPVDDLLEAMVNMDYASFVVAALDPSPQLWKVSAGSTDERSLVGRCWAGDHDEYELSQQRCHEWPEEVLNRSGFSAHVVYAVAAEF